MVKQAKSPLQATRAANASWLTPVVLEITIAVIAIAAHVARIASLPTGFYVDESSIGYNAWMIATTGHDEHGVAARFDTLTYINDPTLTPWGKVGAFVNRYVKYFGPSLNPDRADPQPRSLYIVRHYADLHPLPKVD